MSKFKPFSKIEKSEPWTKRELSAYPIKKRDFIRGIQLKEKCNKDEAIRKSDRYFLLPNRKRKEFSDSVHRAIKDEYPTRKTKRNQKSGQLQTVKQKTRKVKK